MTVVMTYTFQAELKGCQQESTNCQKVDLTKTPSVSMLFTVGFSS